MTQPESIIQSARAYCGDPASHHRRGEIILGFLQELGLETHHRVLNIGCGTLSEGTPIIRKLRDGNFVGIDPNQWLIRAALDNDPTLAPHRPEFLFNSDFDASSAGPFDYVVCHSVLSHTAWWQTQMALMNTRKAVNDGAIWLASLRLHDETTFDTEWQYPGNSYFRLDDIKALAYQCGWALQSAGGLKTRMMVECPADVHDWVTMTAQLSPEAANNIRMDMDERERELREVREIAREVYAQRLRARLEAG